MHQSEVVKKLDWSISKLIRIENGSVGISVTDLRALAGVYRADRRTLEDLVVLARATRTRQWWSAYRQHLSQSFRELIAYEAEAAAIMQLHPTIVPGLLQIEAYMREVIPAAALGRLRAEEVEVQVTVRRTRQQTILDGSVADYTAIVDEAALRRQVGGAAVMRDQLAHLARLAESDDRVHLAVLPFAAGAHPGMQGAFLILDFASDTEPSVLFLETATGSPVQREQHEVELYRAAFAELLDRSLRAGAAAAFIRGIAAAF
jgi:transcriptional regulator with XRE-family HTH domain